MAPNGRRAEVWPKHGPALLRSGVSARSMAFQPNPLNPDDYGDFTRARFYAGETIYTDGMSGNHFYLIKEGEVDIFLVRDERKVTVETLGPGQCFGISHGRAA